MTVTLKRTKKSYRLTIDNRKYKFASAHSPWTLLKGVNERGLDHANEVYDKIRCLYDLGILKKGKRNRENRTIKMLLACGSSISIDNAVRDIITGKSTLDDVLKRKGFLQ